MIFTYLIPLFIVLYFFIGWLGGKLLKRSQLRIFDWTEQDEKLARIAMPFGICCLAAALLTLLITKTADQQLMIVNAKHNYVPQCKCKTIF